MLTKNQDIITEFSGVEFSKYASKTGDFVKEFKSRANQKGQFLNWVNLPSEQLKRVDEIYELAQNLKNLTGAKKLSVMGIGGSKHTVEHMLSINGLNIKGEDIVFYSDVDSASLERFLYKLDNDVLSSNFIIASKSGSTFETKDGFLLSGDLYFAPQKKPPRPLVVLLHSFGARASDWGTLPESLRVKNYNVLALDLRGHGKSVYTKN